MSERIKKAAAAAKEGADALSQAVTAARTRKGEPKVTKPAPPAKEEAPKPPTKAEQAALLDAFITHEKGFLAAVAIPEDTGDAMFAAVEAVLYHKERITKAELAKKYIEEG